MSGEGDVIPKGDDTPLLFPNLLAATESEVNLNPDLGTI